MGIESFRQTITNKKELIWVLYKCLKYVDVKYDLAMKIGCFWYSNDEVMMNLNIFSDFVGRKINSNYSNFRLHKFERKKSSKSIREHAPEIFDINSFPDSKNWGIYKNENFTRNTTEEEARKLPYFEDYRRYPKNKRKSKRKTKPKNKKMHTVKSASKQQQQNIFYQPPPQNIFYQQIPQGIPYQQQPQNIFYQQIPQRIPNQQPPPPLNALQQPTRNTSNQRLQSTLNYFHLPQQSVRRNHYKLPQIASNTSSQPSQSMINDSYQQQQTLQSPLQQAPNNSFQSAQNASYQQAPPPAGIQESRSSLSSRYPCSFDDPEKYSKEEKKSESNQLCFNTNNFDSLLNPDLDSFQPSDDMLIDDMLIDIIQEQGNSDDYKKSNLATDNGLDYPN